MASTCGAPGTGSPVSSSTAGVTTCTGDSSAVRTGSASRAASIASPNPASVSFAASRVLARSTNPADTSWPYRILIRWDARSVGTFPNAVTATAAVFKTGPKLMLLTVPPSGGRAVVVVVHPQRRRGSRYSVRHGIIFTSHTCDQVVPASAAPARSGPQPRHADGGSTRSLWVGTGSRLKPCTGCPG